MGWIARWDRGQARAEAAVATVVLVAMVFFAALQVVLFNLSTRGSVVWATEALQNLDWIDTFLQRGTLCLAFLGASMATSADRHIAIDALPRLFSKRVAKWVRAFVALIAAVVCVFLARVFFSASTIAAAQRPFDYEILLSSGAIHVCDATVVQLQEALASAPAIFCGARSVLAAIGMPAETWAGAALYLVPAMLVVMAARFLLRCVATLTVGRQAADGQDTGP